MEKIRILFYTDLYHRDDPSQDFTLEPADPFVSTFGLSILKNLILKYKPRTVDVEVSLINRNNPRHAAQKLTGKLLSHYDELWVFGYYQANFRPEGTSEFSARYGGPYNELDDDEVAALREWMKCGGVLIMGDHAEKKQQSGHDTKLPCYLGLGRALGYRIPRAGQMRSWDGPPTIEPENSFNTQSPGGIDNLDDLRLQSDSEPQHIYLLSSRNAPHKPHALFYGGPAKRIQVFPDHAHEGKLVIPDLLCEDWPDRSPKPYVVAWGVDNRFDSPHFSPLVSVYNGDSVKVGRIVADSTWHHYININLRCLPTECCSHANCRAATLDKISLYYSNLVFWLAPKCIRDKVKQSLLRWVAFNPQVAEVATGDYLLVGKTAKVVIDSQLAPCEILELSHLTIPRNLQQLPKAFLDLAQELILGYCIKQFYQTDSTDICTSTLGDCIQEALQAYLKELDLRTKDVAEVLNALTSAAQIESDADSSG
jgi:hypothetical protein